MTEHHCPRTLYQQTSQAWYQHLKDCDTCQNTQLPSCDSGETLFDKYTDAYILQNEVGCNSLTCPGKDVDLQDCPGIPNV